MAVQLPHKEVLFAVADISERICLFAKIRNQCLEGSARQYVVTQGDGFHSVVNGALAVPAPGLAKEAKKEVCIPPLEEGVLHLLNLTTQRTGPGEEGEHMKLLPNSCFGKC